MTGARDLVVENDGHLRPTFSPVSFSIMSSPAGHGEGHLGRPSLQLLGMAKYSPSPARF